MGTEVLWPQDLFNQRLRGPHASSSSSTFHRRRNFRANGNLVDNNNKRPQGNSRKKKSGDHDVQPVTLLRRGESLDSLISKRKTTGKTKIRVSEPVDDLAILGTARIGPESPEMRIHLPVYAGSAFALSPSPTALPLPSFFSKKQQQNEAVSTGNPDTDLATRNLRRLLRLN